MGTRKDKKYQVFVSSTYEDLVDERKAVVQAILECKCIPAGMELWPASNKSQWEVIKEVIDESDYYLLVIAGKYGSQTKNSEGKTISYTEMEFDYAVKQKKPIIVLIHCQPEKISVEFSEKALKNQKKLEAFKNKVCDGRLVDFWDTKENLKLAAIRSILNAIDDTPSRGWIRGNACEVLEKFDGNKTEVLNSFAGKWESYFKDMDGTEKSDSYELEYDASTNRLYGVVKRIFPKVDKEYCWNCEGYVVGDNIVMVYWSLDGITRLTCGAVYLRYAKHSEYVGFYITYDYKYNKIIEVPIRSIKL